MEDKELLAGFLAGTLASFPHRDHVRTAYLLLGSSNFVEATRVLSDRIRVMAAEGGNPEKFHETRTVAWMHLIDRARSDDQAPASSDEFLQRHPELLRSSLLDEYYSQDRLTSDAARASFLEPDLSALR
jgi:hypothetical protein